MWFRCVLRRCSHVQSPCLNKKFEQICQPDGKNISFGGKEKHKNDKDDIDNDDDDNDDDDVKKQRKIKETQNERHIWEC